MGGFAIARQAGVGVETIRYYEREGLITRPPRAGFGYREYPPSTAERLKFIRRAKDLGFSLKDIKELLALRLDPGTTCKDIRRRAEAKVMDMDERIRSLKQMRRALKRLADACGSEVGRISECPILDALEEGTKS